MIERIVVTTEPSPEPISVAEAKSHLRIDWPDDDTYLGILITSARQWMEKVLRRALITQTIKATLTLPKSLEGQLSGPISSLSYGIEIPRPPLISITAVEAESSVSTWQSLMNGSDYVVDSDSEPAKIYLASSAFSLWSANLNFPGAKPRIRVTYQAGYGATSDKVPAAIRESLLQAIGYLYENRQNPTIPDSFIPVQYKVMRI
jgi:uncharacterized phiE125 gp8 family phage protein